MDKRTLLAIAISMGIMLVWMKVFPPGGNTPPQPTQSAPAATGTDPAASPTAAGAAAPASGGNGLPATKAGPEQLTTIEGQDARYVLSSWGGVLRQVELTEPRFMDRHTHQGLSMLSLTRPELGNLAVSFPKADFALPAGPWAVSQPDSKTVVYRAESEQVAVEKRYHLDGRFQLGLEVIVENKGDAPLNGNLGLHLYERQDPAKKGGGFFSGQADLASIVCYRADKDKAHRGTVEHLAKEPLAEGGRVGWAAAETKYFTVAAVPHPSIAGERTCRARAVDGENAEGVFAFAPRTIAAHGKTSYAFTVFAGPKYREVLNTVNPGGVESHLDEVVDVNFVILSKPLLYMLKLFHGWVNNWGLAIIMLTLFVKLLTLYPTHRAMMSGKKMQRLGPKMQELRKKYENDRQRLGMETMSLYKQNGVSPLGGCLPSLITMPIWVALFSTLNYAAELYRAPFFGYIHDLSARDPYFITPLIMGGIMFAQMKMTPAGVDPQQQKMMTIMMPVMFTAFSLFLAAGLAIYTLTNSALSILQQTVINRIDRKLHGPVVPVEAKAETKADRKRDQKADQKAEKKGDQKAEKAPEKSK
jgi:YidC/Oxa1 family membrane protein insertase